MVSPGRVCTQPGLSLSDKRTRKPNSVLCGHSSRRRVAANAHQRPTRRFQQLHWSSLSAPGRHRARVLLLAHASLPIWSCSVWGLPCHSHYWLRGALLPHLFTLTIAWSRPLWGSRWIAPKVCPTQWCSMQWRYVFCGTGRPRAFTPASRTLSGTLPCGVRTFLPRQPLLSQRFPAATARSSCQPLVYPEIDAHLPTFAPHKRCTFAAL